MCFGKPPKDNSAELARQQEEARAAKIKQGQAAIDSTFDSRFTDPYYSSIEKDYLDYYNPQLTKQYNEAVDQLTYNLARSGNAQSSTNNKQFGDLLDLNKQATDKIVNDAKAASAKARADVANQRSSLYALNNSSADPTQAASQAAQAALTLNQPQSFSPLGSVFSALITNAGNASAVQNGQNSSFYSSGPSAPQVARGSGKVVN